MSPSTGHVYVGHGTQVITPSGKFQLRCGGLDLADGTPVTATTRQTFPLIGMPGVECKSVETTNGKASGTCHGST